MSLTNKTIIITRPQPQAQPLCQMLSSLGATAISIPSIIIKPVVFLPPATTISASDIAIFVSQNAVIHAKPFWSTWQQQPQLVAIGPSTAKALQAHQLTPCMVPKCYNSEHLLQLPILQNVKNKNIYLCSGTNSRPLISDTLSHRGAILYTITCYQRKVGTLNDPNLPKIDAVVTTSLEGLQNWHSLLHQHQLEPLLNTTTLIIDKKHQHQAQQLGFKRCIVATNSTNKEIIRTLSHHFTH